MKIRVCMLGTVCLLVVGTLFAQQPGGSPGGPPGPQGGPKVMGGPGGMGGPHGGQQPPNDPFAQNFFPPELLIQHSRAIGLTNEQKETIKKEMQSAQAKFTDLQWQLHDAMETMTDLVKADKVDEQKATEQLNKTLALENQIKATHLTLVVRIKNALTPEQQEKLKELRRPSHRPRDFGGPQAQRPPMGQGGPPPPQGEPQ